MKIKFIKSPTGLFNLAYNAGDVVDLKNDDLAKRCIDAKIAIPFLDDEDDEDDVKPLKEKTEKAVFKPKTQKRQW